MPRVIKAAGHTTDQLMIPMLPPRRASPITTRITPNTTLWLCHLPGARPSDAGGGDDAARVGVGSGLGAAAEVAGPGTGDAGWEVLPKSWRNSPQIRLRSAVMESKPLGCAATSQRLGINNHRNAYRKRPT